MKTEVKKAFGENIRSIIEAVVIALLIIYFFIQAFKIPTGSMESTLLVGDHLFVNKFIYGVIRVPFTDIRVLPIRHIRNGDIVVFRWPENPKTDFIKRCMGIPGDTIEIKNKVVYVNGKALDEPYTQHTDDKIYSKTESPRDNAEKFTVPMDKYFCMGDNRDNSNDSRFWGFVPKKNIIGQAMIIYWPLDRIRIIK